MDQSSNFVSSSNNFEDDRISTSGAERRGSTRGMKGVLAIGHKRRMKLPTMVAQVATRSTATSVIQQQHEEDVEVTTQDSEFQPPIELRNEGGHVVLALLFTDEEQAMPLFAQVEVIVNNLRSTTDTPVVMIGSLLPTPIEQQLRRIRDKYAIEDVHNVFFVEGEPFQPKVLNRAFVRVASQFLSLTPSVPPAHADIADRNNIMGQNVLDNKFRQWKRADLAAVFDWCSTRSFSLMPDAPTPFTESPSDPMPNLSDADKEFALSEPRCHYRYAAGRILPKPLIAGVYSMAYYTPGVLELFEALIDPSKTDQEAKPWPIPVDQKFIGQSYSKFSTAMLESGAVPLGVLRAGGPLPYVLSCTPKDEFILNEGDAVYVLASMDWAETNTPFSSLPASNTAN